MLQSLFLLETVNGDTVHGSGFASQLGVAVAKAEAQADRMEATAELRFQGTDLRRTLWTLV